VVSARAVDSAVPQDISTPLQNPPRHAYPSELLTHRFIPMGAVDPDHDMKDDAIAQSNSASMMQEANIEADSQDKSSKKDKDKKAKKRKGEESTSPKKTKKVKTTS
jgi:hypothetical protein